MAAATAVTSSPATSLATSPATSPATSLAATAANPSTYHPAGTVRPATVNTMVTADTAASAADTAAITENLNPAATNSGECAILKSSQLSYALVIS